MRDLRGHRAGAVVLVGALLGTVFVASVGVGYTASRPLNDTGGAVLAKGNSVAYVNGESGKVEAEARQLATGRTNLEQVTLPDGRVAVVENKSGQVWVVDTALMAPQGPAISRSASQAGLAVVAGSRHSYLVDAAAGTVEEIDPAGAPKAPVRVPGGAKPIAVPDSVDGVWVLNSAGAAVHVVDGQVMRTVDGVGRVEHLTLADGRPIAITDAGELLDIAADPAHRITDERVPHGADVVVGSPKGAGRWVLVVDRRIGELIAVDPRTGTRRELSGLPTDQSDLGAPVVVGDKAYVPDSTRHVLYVRDVATGEALQDIPVPGRSLISLEVHGERVWANDQHDRRAVVVGPDGRDFKRVDKGPGEDLTDTSAPPDTFAPRDTSAPPDTEPGESSSEPGTSPGPVPAEPRPDPADVPGSRDGPGERDVPAPAAPVQPRDAVPRGPEQVRVPDIQAGSDKDDACRQIEEAGLLCTPVAVGDGGPANTVIGTDPPGGRMVAQGFRVTVRYHGPNAVTAPQVVGSYADDACQQIEAAGLRCGREAAAQATASPAELDVVAAQDPAGGAAVSTGSVVTVRYPDRVVLADYTNRSATQACADIEATHRGVRCTVADGDTEQQRTQPPVGYGYVQSPAPDTAIAAGQTVTITAVTRSPPAPEVKKVPDVGGMSREDACRTLESAGYTCDARADQIARQAGVTAQDTPAGTPLAPGSTVVIHYAADNPVPLRLYQSDTGAPVYVLRRDGNPETGYTQPHGGILGYGYAEPSAHTWAIWGHFCTGSKATCLGRTPNHYQSRDSQSQHAGWQVQQQGDQFIAPTTPGQCADGQVAIYRFGKFKGADDHAYITAATAPAGYNDYSEFIGCLWTP